MAHTMLSVLVLAVALAIAEALRSASTPVAALVLVVVATLAALTANRIGPMAVACGALAALAWAVLRPITPALAGAGFVVIALLPRTLRVVASPLAVLHAGLSVASGSVAAWATSTWSLGHPSLAHALEQLAAMVLSALALGLPFILSSEDPESYALLQLARRSRGPARWRLLRAVVLRRRALGQLALRSGERRALERAFRELREAADGLVDAGASARSIAESIGLRVVAIGRAVKALASADDEERRLDARSTGAAEMAAEHAEQRREALRSLLEPSTPSGPSTSISSASSSTLPSPAASPEPPQIGGPC